MKLRATLASLSVLASLALSAPAWGGYTLSIDGPAVGPVGGQVQVDVLLALDEGFNLVGANLSVGYDASLMRFVGVTTGLLSPLVPPYDDGLGLVSLELLDPDLIGLTGKLTESIARLSFELRAPGASALGLSGIVLAATEELSLPPADTISVTGPLTVTAVPEPAAPLLAALGLGLLGWTRRRRAG